MSEPNFSDWWPTKIDGLRVFAHGPRSLGTLSRLTGGWGIAAMNFVAYLQSEGLLEPSGEFATYQLTERGRAVVMVEEMATSALQGAPENLSPATLADL
ncbi:MAG: hypothetical protein JSS66_07815 [Armatimonadetes bacterium]|nr:hypothetical protein [Armatimonadota bacterium]